MIIELTLTASQRQHAWFVAEWARYWSAPGGVSYDKRSRLRCPGTVAWWLYELRNPVGLSMHWFLGLDSSVVLSKPL